MATALYSYVPPLLRENEVYPIRGRDISIRTTFGEAAIALDCYEKLQRDNDKTAERLLLSIGAAAQLILEASGQLTKNEKFFSYLTKKEIEVDHRSDFISVYRPVFPEIDVEKIRQIDQLAPMFAEKTRELAGTLANPERLTHEERTSLAQKLIDLSNSIHHEQYRANYFR